MTDLHSKLVFTLATHSKNNLEIVSERAIVICLTRSRLGRSPRIYPDIGGKEGQVSKEERKGKH